MPQPKNLPETPFRWRDQEAVPMPALEELPTRNVQRIVRMARTSEMALADVYDALCVLLFSQRTAEWLRENDPKALQQAERAMMLASPDLPNPYRVGDAVLYRDADQPQYVRVESIESDGRLMVRKGDGFLIGIDPWDYRIRPDDED